MDIKLYTTKESKCIENTIPRSYLKTFMSNPFIYEGAPVQLRAEDDNKVLGSVYAFPLEVASKEGKIYSVCAGSTLSVEPESRGMGLAKKMTLKRLELTKDKIAIASGLSSMSLPLFKKLGFSVFTSKRNIFLKNSRPVIEMLFSGGLLRFFTAIADVFLRLQSYFLKCECKNAMKGLSLVEVTEVPDMVSELVRQDQSLFRENHTKQWFEWVLTGGFNSDVRSKQHLFVIKDREEIVGFFMTKERFHEQASSRGFKNVILGSVIEWGVKPGSELKENKLLLCALLSFGKHVDAVELCSSYESINRYMRRRFLVPVGESNFAIKAHEESPLSAYPEYKEHSSWRIRPAASDNSFN